MDRDKLNVSYDFDRDSDAINESSYCWDCVHFYHTQILNSGIWSDDMGCREYPSMMYQGCLTYCSTKEKINE